MGGQKLMEKFIPARTDLRAQHKLLAVDGNLKYRIIICRMSQILNEGTRKLPLRYLIFLVLSKPH